MKLVKRNFQSPRGLFPLLFDHLYADDTRIKHNLDRQRAWHKEWQRRLTNSTVTANIISEDEQFILELAAPGFEKEHFNIELENGVLTIHANKTVEEGEESPKTAYSHREFTFDAFKRTFNVPEEQLEVEAIKAEYNAGILTVILPKKEIEDTKRNIHVQ